MNQNTIIEQLSYNRDSGALTYRDVRYLLIRPETIVGFQKSIEKYSITVAQEALFQGGYRGGYLSAKRYKEAQNLSDIETIRFMMSMGAEIGWGNFRLIKYDFKNRNLQIRVKNSAFAEAYGQSSKGVCHLVSGVLSGLGTVLFACNCTASESHCLAKGNKDCVFHVSEANRGFQ